MNGEHKEDSVARAFHHHLGKGEHASPSAGTDKGRAFLNCEGPFYEVILKHQHLQLCLSLRLFSETPLPFSASK